MRRAAVGEILRGLPFQKHEAERIGTGRHRGVRILARVMPQILIRVLIA
jgi:hypothetical protein